MIQRGCAPNTPSFCKTLNSMMCNDNKSRCSCGICSKDYCNDDSIETNSFGSGLNASSLINFDIMNLSKDNNALNSNDENKLTCFSCNSTDNECDSSSIATKSCNGPNNSCLVNNLKKSIINYSTLF
jgi:hypothetical protein